MKKGFLTIFIVSGLLLPISFEARADFFGGDDAILGQILQETVLELEQLKQILQGSRDTLDLLNEVNRGINDAIRLADTLGVRVDPGLYRDLKKVDTAVKAVQDIYGSPVSSPLAVTQENTDQTVAEAISFNNELNDYAQHLDQIGEDIKTLSESSSPGKATKLTAVSMGILIHIMDQQIRATGQGLKLQAQMMAVQNKKDKDQTAQYLREGQDLGQRMVGLNPSFEVPRF